MFNAIKINIEQKSFEKTQYIPPRILVQLLYLCYASCRRLKIHLLYAKLIHFSLICSCRIDEAKEIELSKILQSEHLSTKGEIVKCFKIKLNDKHSKSIFNETDLNVPLLNGNIF